MDFLAGEAVSVDTGLSATGRNQVSERIITILGCQRLAGVHQIRHIAIAVREIMIVRASVAARITGGA